ncbi:S1C family serine protease [Microbacterium sp. No. 7]|uniref:S1C family serine protease n=1 Tax=Microbacterium sp. No. 7 TaxID=1714373 RepID=UPI0006CF3794|nr:trypsin-like peptidase domain-containing protein [Microbacterium sp. No. 7]ALJ19980.1 serine protease [Microbacterium sp. No. 7]
MSDTTPPPHSEIPPRPPLPTPAYAPPAAGTQLYSTPAPAHGSAAPADAADTLPYATTGPTQPLGPLGVAPEAPPQPDNTPEGKVGTGRIVAIMVAAALIGGVAGVGGSALGATLFAPTSVVGASSPTTVTVNNPDAVTPTTAIAAKVVPSVVTISASSGTEGGTGSGVILSEDGYVVTNTHVVTLDGATGEPRLSVTTSDGRVYAAEIVGLDPVYDLAVIKLVDASGLTPIEFADSGALNVGDQTVAVGAPLGLSNTVTTGIVSALNRSIQIASSAVPDSSGAPEDEGTSPQSPFEFDFGQGQQQRQATGTISIAVIQTDAAINPGNSGGALVDAEGRLIGINVAIASTGGYDGGAGSIGVGFSIPSDIVQRVTGEIIEDGAATHGLLGASVRDAAAQDGATISGALLQEATGGGAAASAGLRAGDVITSFNGVPITGAIDLTAQVRALAAGSEAEVVYVRDGSTHTATVTLGTLDL